MKILMIALALAVSGCASHGSARTFMAVQAYDNNHARCPTGTVAKPASGMCEAIGKLRPR